MKDVRVWCWGFFFFFFLTKTETYYNLLNVVCMFGCYMKGSVSFKPKTSMRVWDV